MYLGSFATAEEAALCVARPPEWQAKAAKRAAAPAERAAERAAAERAAEKAAAAPVPLTSEEALQQAQAEGRELRTSKKGYFGVHLNKPGSPSPTRRR